MDRRVFSEMLVHPALLAAPSPRRVLLVAAAGSVALCEILKHRAVDHVLVVSADEKAGALAVGDFACAAGAKHVASTVLPLSWLLSAKVGGGANRTHTRADNGGDGTAKCANSSVFRHFDAVIVDPGPRPRIARVAERVAWVLRCVLRPDGVAVLPVGAPPSLIDAAVGKPPTAESMRALAVLDALYAAATEDDTEWRSSVQAAGSRSSEPTPGGLVVFDEHVASLASPLTFAVACMDRGCSSRFAVNDAGAEHSMARRLTPGARWTLVWFDGAAMASLRVKLSRGWEALRCAVDGTRRDCAWLDGHVIDAPPLARNEDDAFDDPEGAVFELRASGKPTAPGENATDITLFAKVDTPAGLVLYDAATSARFSTRDVVALERIANEIGNEHFAQVVAWIDRYGFGCTSVTGEHAWFVSVGSRLTFVNHACSASEGTIEGAAPAALAGASLGWSASYARFPRAYCMAGRLPRDVAAGTPILEDYAADFDAESESKEAQDNATYAEWCKGKR